MHKFFKQIPYIFFTLKNVLNKNDQTSLTLGFVLLGLTMLLIGLAELSFLNEKTTNGYVLNKLSSETQELVEDAEISDMLILRARAMAEIESVARSKGMHKPAREDIAFVLPMHVVAQK